MPRTGVLLIAPNTVPVCSYSLSAGCRALIVTVGKGHRPRLMSKGTNSPPNTALFPGHVDISNGRSDADKSIMSLSKPLGCGAVSPICRIAKSKVSAPLEKRHPFAIIIIGFPRRRLSHSQVVTFPQPSSPPTPLGPPPTPTATSRSGKRS